MNTESQERTERGAWLVGAGIIVSRILGLVRGTVYASFFGGESMQSDAYNAASRIPNAMRNLLGEGAISASFVPVYAAALERGDERGARALANALLGVLLAGVALLTLLGIAFAPLLTAVLVPGFKPEQAELTTRLLRVMFPMTGLMVLSGWCLGVQNAHRRFFIAYASGAMWSVVQIALLLSVGWGRDLTTLAWWLSWATLGGAVLQIAVQLPQVFRLMETVRPTLDLNAPGLRTTLGNFIPVVSALGLFQISIFIDQQIGSFLPTSAITNFTFAYNLFLLPLSLFGVATAAAALPQMARDSARSGSASIGVGLARTWERVLFYTIPSAVAFVGIGDCIVGILYQYRRFNAEQRDSVYVVLIAFALGLVAYASARLLSSSYQATGNYRTPFRSSVTALVVSVVTGASIALAFRTHVDAVAGLALGGSLGAHVNLARLMRGLDAQVGGVDLTGPKRVARLTFLVSLAALVPSVALRMALMGRSIHLTAVIVIPVYCGTFLFAARRAGLADADRLYASITRKFARR